MVRAKGSLGQTFSHPRGSYQPPYGHKPRLPVVSLQTPLRWYHTCFLLFLTLAQHHDSPGKSSEPHDDTLVAWGENKLKNSKPSVMMRGEERMGTF